MGGARPGEITALALKSKKWVLSLAAVSCDRTVCVVGTGKDVTIGITELGNGELSPSLTACLKSKGEKLLSSCLCQDRLLLLCESMTSLY